MSLAALTFLEIVLGIDNVVFLSIVAGKLPKEQQAKARWIGLWVAMVLRVAMLFGVVWITKLDFAALNLPEMMRPMAIAFTGGPDAQGSMAHGGGLAGQGSAADAFMVITVKDLVLIGGGLFLLAKGTLEIHHEMDDHHDAENKAKPASFMAAMMQIAVINIVFSLDSVITAIGMTDVLWIMVAAVVIFTLVMLVAASPVSAFIAANPTTKMLALSFILLVGVALLADGLGFHIPRGYLYFAIAFPLLVEVLNVLARKRKRTHMTP